MSFRVQRLKKTESLGAQLKALRQKQFLTLEQAADKTKIQPCYLHALESGNYHNLPEPVYVRLFLKTYARTLGADVHYLLSCYAKERQTCDFAGSMQLPRQKKEKKQNIPLIHFWKMGLCGFAICTFCFYVAYTIFGLVHQPEVTIFAPIEGLVTNQAVVHVTGKGEKDTQIIVNTIPTLPNEEGIFSAEIVLKEGTNIITVEGSRRYSKTTTLHRHVVFHPQKISSLDLSQKKEPFSYPQ